MKIKLDVTKSLERNAETYFEKSKKAKQKLEGARIALEKSIGKLEILQKDQKQAQKEKEIKQSITREWYEKFRWFFSSEGFLCIGGRDAATNEIVIKKHTEKEDIVFHSSMAGSPFFVIKAEGRKPGEATLKETAQATASYSRAWKSGLASAEVFYVNPDQVTKEAKSGEFIARGAFMIYGKKNLVGVDLKLASGIKDGKIIGGPVDAIKSQTKDFVIINQGTDKASDIAKKIKKRLGAGELDDIIRMLPSGTCSIAK
jgi:predicted ribosome quality control (RQC) complex YloA/Tae2 family protein